MSLRVNFGATSVTTKCHNCWRVKATWWAQEDGKWLRICYDCVYWRVGKTPPHLRNDDNNEWVPTEPKEKNEWFTSTRTGWPN